MTSRQQALREVQMLDFALQEAELYLDVHPKNNNALNYFKENQQLARAARANYEKLYGPLTYQHENKDCFWNWIEGPWPWEGDK